MFQSLGALAHRRITELKRRLKKASTERGAVVIQAVANRGGPPARRFDVTYWRQVMNALNNGLPPRSRRLTDPIAVARRFYRAAARLPRIATNSKTGAGQGITSASQTEEKCPEIPTNEDPGISQNRLGGGCLSP
jgi:hypothetical protein